MTFVTADSNRSRLEDLTKLLVSAFPGSTIYQHVDPMRASGDVLQNRITGVFLEAEMEKVSGIELMRKLRRQHEDLPVYILSETEELRDSALQAGAAGYFLRPLTARVLQEAILPKERLQQRECEEKEQ